MKKKYIILLAILLIGLFLFGAKYAYDAYLFHTLPIDYEEFVLASAEKYDISPYTLFAVIKTESDFRADVISPSGAVGLMQLMPGTLEWLCGKRGEEYSENFLYDPENNIDYGAYYLAWLYERFGDWELAFASYNAGQNKVSEWLENKEYSKNGKLVTIPYSETESYVKRIKNYKKAYERLYSEKGWSIDE